MSLLYEAPQTEWFQEMDYFEQAMKAPAAERPADEMPLPETSERRYQTTELGYWAVAAWDMERLESIKAHTDVFPVGLAHMLDLRHRNPDGSTTLDNHERRQLFGTQSDDELRDYIIPE